MYHCKVHDLSSVHQLRRHLLETSRKLDSPTKRRSKKRRRLKMYMDKTSKEKKRLKGQNVEWKKRRLGQNIEDKKR
jgi:hypothetical protein